MFKGWSVRAAEGIIEAQHMREVAGCFGLAARFPLPEILAREYLLHTVNEIFSAQQTHRRLLPLDGDDGHQPSARQEKSPEPIPVPRLAGRSGNSFIEGMQDGIERGNVGWAGRRSEHTPPLYQTGLCYGDVSVVTGLHAQKSEPFGGPHGDSFNPCPRVDGAQDEVRPPSLHLTTSPALRVPALPCIVPSLAEAGLVSPTPVPAAHEWQRLPASLQRHPCSAAMRRHSSSPQRSNRRLPRRERP